MERSSSASSRVSDDIAEDAARRLAKLSLITAICMLLMIAAFQVLQPELRSGLQTPLYRLSLLFFVLLCFALSASYRFRVLQPRQILDLGLFLEVTGAFVIGVVENSVEWPDTPIRGSTGVAAWIAVAAMVVVNRPWKSFVAVAVSAAMVPVSHWVSAAVHGYPPMPTDRLVAYSLVPAFLVIIMPFLVSRVYQMQKDLSGATELGSYRLVTLLGKGGMGEVWRAQHRLLRRGAAVKLVAPELLARAGESQVRSIRQRFELEAQAIASLRSPHTVALYDFGLSDDGALYYAMELLEGLDVDSLVRNHGPQPAARVISILRQACESLEEAHGLGLVHRDLKPTNLFVCRLGTHLDFVKVLDFGLVKALLDPGQTQLTMQGDLSGTPAFMAPEQVRGEPLDARADVYGLGCVAYFLLTGELVFSGRTPLAAALAHVEQIPDPPSARTELAIPPSLERVVMACLEKDRENRPRSASDLANLLEACEGVLPWTKREARQWWDAHHPVASNSPQLV